MSGFHSSCAETYKGMVIALVSARRVKDCFDVRTGVSGIAVKQMKTAQKELRIADLSFSYTGERFLFRHLNAVFTFPRLYAVKGENGCGKTTLLNIIAGTLRPVGASGASASRIRNLRDAAGQREHYLCRFRLNRRRLRQSKSFYFFRYGSA